MRFAYIVTIFAASASAASLQARRKGRKGAASGAAVAAGAGAAAGGATGAATGAATGGATGSANTAAAGAVQRGDTTLVFKEDGGVPGNECLTFRNNGEFSLPSANQRPWTLTDISLKAKLSMLPASTRPPIVR